MKKIIYLITVLGFVSCQNSKNDYVSLSGKISNIKVDSISIYGNNRYSKKIAVNKDGSFKDTLTIEEGFFAITDGKSQAFLRLKKGYNLNVNADANDFQNSLTFTGDGASTNNYLATKIRTQKEFGLDNLESFFLLSKTDFDSKVSIVDASNKKLLNETKGLDTAFVSSEKLANERIVQFLNSNYEVQHLKLTKFAIGKPSPTFNLENYKGGKTSLGSLKGKYVYIDVWATWCAPCRKQIPALKKIEEEYSGKQIVFVSLSIDKKVDKAKWRKMVQDDKLGGIQLFAENDWNSAFVKAYQIAGIPRFILIDPQGNIVDADAPRPTDPRLKALFNSLKL
ncbi:MAG: TlpA family protein disulfide reductase [Flavobacteriaceae bacterium]|nr:TlpA family protein disulfide reductase [Flavobacteriaceae bacterium]